MKAPKTWHVYSNCGRWYVIGRHKRKIFWTRIVMWNEIGRELRRDEVVHHVNGDPGDDRVENLRIVSRAEHFAIHRAQGDFDHVLSNLREVAQRSNIARRRRVTLTCAGCGRDFERTPAEAAKSKLAFCSRACRFASQSDRVSLQCTQCGRTFDGSRRRAAKQCWGNFCSHPCWATFETGRPKRPRKAA